MVGNLRRFDDLNLMVIVNLDLLLLHGCVLANLIDM